ncbi:MAG TPA: response regulator [Terriglobia bacterium]|nr:response regulator [Terriglobia bacterium]
MKLLIAEDHAISRRMLEATCRSWGFDVLPVQDGEEAWRVLQKEDAPPLVLLDWMMPGIDGLEVIRRVRSQNSSRPVYIILLTARSSREDIINGLLAAADDYVTKPFDRQELHARLQAGVRIVRLQLDRAARVAELEEALGRVKKLQGLLPICSYCKRIRNDENYWQQVECYIEEHSGAEFTHGVCPQCYDEIVRPELDQLLAR